MNEESTDRLIKRVWIDVRITLREKKEGHRKLLVCRFFIHIS